MFYIRIPRKGRVAVLSEKDKILGEVIGTHEGCGGKVVGIQEGDQRRIFCGSYPVTRCGLEDELAPMSADTPEKLDQFLNS